VLAESVPIPDENAAALKPLEPEYHPGEPPSP